MCVAADLLAVDVGTSRVKFGWFSSSSLPITSPQLPQPAEAFACRHRDVPKGELAAQITEWLSQLEAQHSRIALCSVSPETTQAVTKLLSKQGFAAVQVLTGNDLSLDVQVKEPLRVGIDRLLSAVAVNRVRKADRPAIVMDLGTAVTVDLISHSGSFLGGAILPGWSLSASALHGGTSSLPLLTPDNGKLPEDGLGKCTREAIAAGLTWGLIGALGKLVDKYAELTEGTPQLFLTGGDAPLVFDGLVASATSRGVDALGPIRYVPHLVLAGIAIATEVASESVFGANR